MGGRGGWGREGMGGIGDGRDRGWEGEGVGGEGWEIHT